MTPKLADFFVPGAKAWAIMAQRFWLGLRRAWVLVFALVVVLSLVRLGQLIYFWPQTRMESGAELLNVLYLGLRFDIKAGCIGGIAALLVMPCLSARAGRWFGAAALLGYALLSLINLHYIGFYKSPIDMRVFGLLDGELKAVLLSIWQDFPVGWTLLAALAATAVALACLRGVSALAQPEAKLHGLRAALRQTAMAASYFLFVYQIPMTQQHFTATASSHLNDMIPNGVMALSYAWDARYRRQDLSQTNAGLAAYGFASAQEAATALGMPERGDAQIAAALTRHAPLVPGQPKKNLLFFLMESWSAEPLLYHQRDFDVLGRLAPTLKGACHFSNFDSGFGATHFSLEALLFSTPLVPLTYGDVNMRPIPWSVAALARQAGYRTVFLTSGRGGWSDLHRVLPAQGFDEVIDAAQLKKQFPDPPEGIGVWGIWDAYIYRYLSQRLAQHAPSDKPLFVFVLTTTNHTPYLLPSDYTRQPRDLSRWQGDPGEPLPEQFGVSLDTYHYATDLLGGFVQEFQRSPHYPNTVLAAVGDHNGRTFGQYSSHERAHLRNQVPFVIWGDGLDCGTQAKLPASHRDVFPTLLPLIGVEGPYVNTGRDLLAREPRPDDPRQAPHAVQFTGIARNSQGRWKLGDKHSFACTPAPTPGTRCEFDALADLHERARLGLLDWYVRSKLQRQ